MRKLFNNKQDRIYLTEYEIDAMRLYVAVRMPKRKNKQVSLPKIINISEPSITPKSKRKIIDTKER